jgi:uncharacterized protein YndB with AHSA1/START domain
MENRAVKKSLLLKASPAVVWQAITDPETIKRYFFGTNVETDWKPGSPITYSGNWKGKEYKDRGTILEVDKEKKLSHTHWSSLSELPDIPENYYTVTYELEPRGEDTLLTVVQAGNMSKETFEHSCENWEMVLQKLKEILEKVPA